MCLLAMCMSSFDKHLFRFFCSIFDWVCFSGTDFHELLEINSLTVASIAIIITRFESCLFTLLIVSLIVKKLLILIMSYLHNFAFISIILGGGS